MDKKIISFELPLDLYEAIKIKAKNESRSVSNYIRVVLEHDLKNDKIKKI